MQKSGADCARTVRCHGTACRGSPRRSLESDTLLIGSWRGTASGEPGEGSVSRTLIAGIYGMNFDDMPELRWRYRHATAMGLMAIVDGYLFYRFRRSQWL